MIKNTFSCMLVDDEAPMRDLLRLRLKKVWPELNIIAEATNGIAAIEQFEIHHPDIIFLDIRMPGKTGLEAASELTRKAHIVFVTAYDEYAISAFEKGAIDYLLKPVDIERLEQTCLRLKERLSTNHSSSINQSEAVQQLLSQLMTQHQSQNKEYLRWIQASVGNSLRMINIKEVLFFKSDEKYTLVQTEQAEFLIRKTLKELEEELDPKQFWRIHRSTLVNVSAISEVNRDPFGKHTVGLKGHSSKLEVSRNHTHLFQQM